MGARGSRSILFFWLPFSPLASLVEFSEASHMKLLDGRVLVGGTVELLVELVLELTKPRARKTISSFDSVK